MKVLILGSGVIGVTSAYYLARAGHEVTVVDRQPEPALEVAAIAHRAAPTIATDPEEVPTVPRAEAMGRVAPAAMEDLLVRRLT